MKAPKTVILEVTQDCIDRATRNPHNCPFARAARNSGIHQTYAGYAAITGTDNNGRAITADISSTML